MTLVLTRLLQMIQVSSRRSFFMSKAGKKGDEWDKSKHDTCTSFTRRHFCIRVYAVNNLFSLCTHWSTSIRSIKDIVGVLNCHTSTFIDFLSFLICTCNILSPCCCFRHYDLVNYVYPANLRFARWQTPWWLHATWYKHLIVMYHGCKHSSADNASTNIEWWESVYVKSTC